MDFEITNSEHTVRFAEERDVEGMTSGLMRATVRADRATVVDHRDGTARVLVIGRPLRRNGTPADRQIDVRVRVPGLTQRTESYPEAPEWLAEIVRTIVGSA